MNTLLLITHIFVSVVLILVVLLQAGRGGGVGAGLGGASQQIFGGRGASSFLAKVTTACAVVFFLTSLTLSFLSSRDRSVVQRALDKKADVVAPAPSAETPAADSAPAAAPEAAPEPEAAPAPEPAPTPAAVPQEP